MRHTHTVQGGLITHEHPVSDPIVDARDAEIDAEIEAEDGPSDYVDEFCEAVHTHLLVLTERNYISEFTGEAKWIDDSSD